MTSDHGLVQVLQYLTDLGISGGYVQTSDMANDLREYLQASYGEDFILSFSNGVYLDHHWIDQQNLNHREVQEGVARFILSYDGTAGVLTRDALSYGEFSRGVRALVQDGYNQKRSADVVFWLHPQSLSGNNPQGTTHGSPWAYDTHAPMHWYGWNIPFGRSSHPAFISDIASTVAIFLNVPFPRGSTSTPLNEHMKPK